MGEGKRKREGAVSEADKALKSPRLVGQAATGKSLDSLGLLNVQYAAASPSDSNESSPETTSSSDSDGSSGRCEHMCLDSESVDIAVYDIKDSEELPTCFHPECRITWKGAGESKEGMMKCIECHYISCAGWPMDIDNPGGHALSHADICEHYVAQWYHAPNLGYCFVCQRVMRLSDNQDRSSDDEVDRKVKDDRGMVASKTTDQRGMVTSRSKDDRGILPSISEIEWEMVGSNSKLDGAMVASNAMDRWGMARDDASGYATGDGYVIRGMLNHGNTCYMNASMQCLLALGKLRTMILEPDTRLGDIGLDLKQLFVETSSANNARHMLDPGSILGYMRSLYQGRFKASEMGDSHELLTSLHNALDNEVVELNLLHLKQGGDVSLTFGESIFKGQQIEIVSCKSCSHKLVIRRVAFSDLSLPLPARSVAECGNSQIPGLGLEDGAIEETPKPLQVDSCEVKDGVHSCLLTQKNDVPREVIEVPIEALDFIPKLFDDTGDMEKSPADSYNPEDKEKAQSSDTVHDEAQHMNSLGSIEDCLTLFFDPTDANCQNCRKVAELPETNGNVEPIMESTNVNTTSDGDQTELSDRKTCPSKRSSDFNSLSVDSPSSQAYPSDSHQEVILSDDLTTEEITSGTSCDEKDLASCSKADAKAESHEGVQEAAPCCLPTDKQTDLMSAQDIQDTSTQKQGSGKQIMYDHSTQQVAEKQNKQTDGNGGASRTQLISKLPSVLTIHRKRNTSALSKLRGHVSFKEILHLGPFMDPSSEDKDKFSYRLVGVIEHIGHTPNTGHYVAYVRGSGSSSWVCAGDLSIKAVSLEEVLRREAYILFYERMEG